MRIPILSANPPPFFQNITQSLKVWTVLVQRKNVITSLLQQPGIASSKHANKEKMESSWIFNVFGIRLDIL